MVRVIKLENIRKFPDLKELTKELTEDQRMQLVIIYNSFRFLEKNQQESALFDSIVKISRISSLLKNKMIL
jgi:hypothetical protein